MIAQKGNKVNIVFNKTDRCWLIQKEDEPTFFFSNSQHWTNDTFDIKDYWYHHQASNMAIKKGFEIIIPAIITFLIIDDHLIIYIDDVEVETTVGIITENLAKEYIKTFYSYKYDKDI